MAQVRFHFRFNHANEAKLCLRLHWTEDNDEIDESQESHWDTSLHSDEISIFLVSFYL